MKKVIISGMLGNALEWYDYALYAQFAYIIGDTFLGGASDSTKHIITFAIFALGFVIRPLGALIFSFIGDKFGRKAALSLSIMSMAIPTAVIGILPSYQVIGIMAPIILAVMRLLQGLSLGGEFSVCISYLVEHAPKSKYRGLIGSIPFVSMCLGILLGSFISYFMKLYIPATILRAWAWRIPFVAGFLIGLVGLYIRKRLTESPLYIKAKSSGLISAIPTKKTLKENWPALLLSSLMYITVTAPFYTLTVYTETFLHKVLHYSTWQTTVIHITGIITMTVVMPISALITDKIGRKPVLTFSGIMIALCIYPIFLLFGMKDFWAALGAEIIFGVLLGSYMGPIPTVLVEIFPTSFRLTGIALSYNLAAAIFGGTAPMVAMMLIRTTGNVYSMGIYLTCLVTFSISIVVKYFQESYQKDLSL